MALDASAKVRGPGADEVSGPVNGGLVVRRRLDFDELAEPVEHGGLALGYEALKGLGVHVRCVRLHYESVPQRYIGTMSGSLRDG